MNTWSGLALGVALGVAAMMVLGKNTSHQMQIPLPAGSTSPGAAQVDPGAPISVASYGIGYNRGTELRHGLAFDEVEVDPDALFTGFQAGLAGAPSQIAPEVMEDALADLHEQVAERATAKLREMDPAYAQLCKDNAAASAAFMANNAQRDGVKTLDTGVQYEVLTAGDGPSPQPTDTIVAHYRIELIDGTKVVEERDAEAEIAGMIKAGGQIIPMMKTGDRWRIVVPPELAHGATGKGTTIGPNQALVCDVELVSIKSSN